MANNQLGTPTGPVSPLDFQARAGELRVTPTGLMQWDGRSWVAYDPPLVVPPGVLLTTPSGLQVFGGANVDWLVSQGSLRGDDLFADHDLHVGFWGDFGVDLGTNGCTRLNSEPGFYADSNGMFARGNLVTTGDGHIGGVLDVTGDITYNGSSIAKPDFVQLKVTGAGPGIPNASDNGISYALDTAVAGGNNASNMWFASQPSYVFAPSDGRYLLVSNLRWAAGAVGTGERSLTHKYWPLVNGAFTTAQRYGSQNEWVTATTQAVEICVTSIIDAKAGDAFQTTCFQASGGTLSFMDLGGNNRFTVTKLSSNPGP